MTEKFDDKLVAKYEWVSPYVALAPGQVYWNERSEDDDRMYVNISHLYRDYIYISNDIDSFWCMLMGSMNELVDQLSWLLSSEAAHLIANRIVNMYYYGCFADMMILFADDPHPYCDWSARDIVTSIKESRPILYELLQSEDIVLGDYSDPSRNPANQKLINKVADYISTRVSISCISNALRQIRVVLSDACLINKYLTNKVLPLADAARFRDAINELHDCIFDIFKFQFEVSKFYTLFYANHTSDKFRFNNHSKIDYDSQSKLWEVAFSYQRAIKYLESMWDCERDPGLDVWYSTYKRKQPDYFFGNCGIIGEAIDNALRVRERTYYDAELINSDDDKLVTKIKETCGKLYREYNPNPFQPRRPFVDNRKPDKYNAYYLYHITDNLFEEQCDKKQWCDK